MHNNYTGEQQYCSYHVIIPKNNNCGHLILGDFNAAVNEQMLIEKQVKTIITAAMGFQHLNVPNSITHIVFPLADINSQNIKAYFEESYHIIEENLKKGGVLVHCGAGVSRSATLVIAYYMKKNKEDFKTSIAYVRNIRPVICPNLGFQKQLKLYQTELLQPHHNKNSQYLSVKNQGKRTINQDDSKSQKNGYKSIFNFEPNIKTNSVKKPQRKIIAKTHKKPKLTPQINSNNFKNFYEIAETKLFITGKAASRPTHSSNNQSVSSTILKNDSDIKIYTNNTTYRNPMLGTWGHAKKHSKHLQFARDNL